MKLRLEIAGQRDRVEVEAQPFAIRLDKGMFSVTTPDGDDWQRSVDFDLLTAGAEIYSQGGGLVFRFPTAIGLEAFKNWLVGANAKAAEGYKTMRP